MKFRVYGTFLDPIDIIEVETEEEALEYGWSLAEEWLSEQWYIEPYDDNEEEED